MSNRSSLAVAGIVGNDHRVAHQAVVTDGAPKAGFGKRANVLPIEDIDALSGQMHHERHVVAETLRFKSPKSGDYDRIATALFQIVECRIIEHIVMIAGTKQRRLLPAELCFQMCW